MAVNRIDEIKKGSGIIKMPLPLLFVILLARAKLFELHDPGLVPDPPGDNLPGVFPVVGFDDCPAAVMAVVAAPLEKVKVARSVDFLDNGIAVTGFVG
jgi:hypothetical protein